MYTFEATVRQSETDRNERLRYEKLVDFFQDCACFQSSELGVGADYLRERRLFWVLSTWNIEIKRRPGFREEIVIGTAPYELKGFFGKRNFRLTTKDGEILATADTLWTMLDLGTGRPVRIPEEVAGGYEIGEKLPMEYIRSRIVIPKELEKKEELRVTEHYIDNNLHMNNSCYVEASLDAFSDLPEIGRIRVEYHKQARKDDVLGVWTGMNETGYVAVITDENGEKYAVTEVLC